ncbi:MAG: hypothetical protein ACI3Y5_06025, partial [Prevotella sp.]
VNRKDKNRYQPMEQREQKPNLTKGLLFVYRLEENGGLLQEGGGGAFRLGALRACSYKTKPKDPTPGALPPIIFKGFIMVFVIRN